MALVRATRGTWLTSTHRCYRPHVDQVESAGHGIGSRWQCPDCSTVHRIVDFDVAWQGGHMQAVVRWEVERVA
jgi:hypothetical protein